MPARKKIRLSTMNWYARSVTIIWRRRAGKPASGNRRGSQKGDSPELLAGLQKYHETVEKHAAEDNDVSDAVIAERQKELDDVLAEIGKRMLDLQQRGSTVRQSFGALTDESQRRTFLTDLGRKKTSEEPAVPAKASEKTTAPNGEPNSPPGAADPRLAMGEKHLSGESEIPLRLLSHRDKPLEVHRLLHGDLDQPAELVEPCLPAKIAADEKLDGVLPDHRRAALANWLTSATIRSRRG